MNGTKTTAVVLATAAAIAGGAVVLPKVRAGTQPADKLAGREAADARSGQPTSATVSTRPAAAGVSQFAWIAGAWRTSLGKDELEELWGDPIGNQMAGVFRWVKDGKIWMNELITITDEGGRIVFRLRHFSSDMVPWEEKDAAITLPLVRSSEREAVFESTDAKHPMRFTYSRSSEGRMIVAIESTKEEGKPATKAFEFTRR